MGSGNVRVVMWKCVFNNVEMHIWLWEYAFLVMLGYGHDESAPTPGGVFCGVSWVGVTLFVNRSQCYRQSVRSCRGPIYRARVHEIPQNGVAYLHCWCCNSHHFDTSKPFGSDWKTGAMNRPLRLAECTLPYICVINEYCGMFVDIYMRNK